MRIICACHDDSEGCYYADFVLTKDMAATILTARKKLLELK